MLTTGIVEIALSLGVIMIILILYAALFSYR